jgi:hypothetical protein
MGKFHPSSLILHPSKSEVFSIMKLQKIILSAAVATTAFGVSLGLLELGRYFAGGFSRDVKNDVKNSIKPLASPVPFQTPEPVWTPSPRGYGEAFGGLVVQKSPDEESCKWGETGDYKIIGAPPKGFEDVDYLSVVTNDYDEKTGEVVAVKPYGALQTTEEFSFSWLNLTNKRISFVTQVHKGVSYQFDGKFVREELKTSGEGDDEVSEYILLKGRLAKWRNGIKIAEAKLKFTEICGC